MKFPYSSFCRPRKNPLFIIDLALDSYGVHFSTPLENFETSVVSLFNKGILATHSIPQLEKVSFSQESEMSSHPDVGSSL